MIKIRIAAVVTVALAALTGFPGPSGAQTRRAALRAADAVLFGPAAPDAAALGVQRPWELRRRLATVELDVLRPLCRPPVNGVPDTISINLFDDVTVVAESQAVGRTDRLDSVRWTGDVVDEPGSQVTFSAVGLCAADPGDFSFAGTVRFGGKEYGIRPRPGGRVVISEIDTLAAGLLQKPDPLPHPASPAGIRLGDAEPPAGESSVIDALILYTPGAVRTAGGKNEIESWITDAVARANDEFADSGAHVTFRVADMELDPDYTGGETVEPAFRHLTETTDGQLDSAVTLRQRYGADIVTTVVAGYDPHTGVAGLASYPENPHNPETADQAWAVVSADQLWAFVLAHEWGHLLGLDHDWKTSPDTDPYYPDNHGYVSPDNKFVTIMGYPTACTPACPYAPYFANPNITYQGESLGVPLGRSARSSDNARIINLTAPQVAAYRSARAALPGNDLTIGAATGGTAAPGVPGPYSAGDTVAVDAHPAPGYTLAGWTLDGVRREADDPFSLTMDRDHTLTPRFARTGGAGYQLATVVSPARGGGIALSPRRSGYAEDTDVTATAEPGAGYAFQGWLLDGRAAGDDPRVTVRMSGDHTLTAQFARAMTLRIDGTPGGRVTATGDGTNAVVRAEPVPGYVFGRWLLNGRPFGTSPVITVHVTGGELLTAVFSQVRKPAPAPGKHAPKHAAKPRKPALAKRPSRKRH